MSTSRGRIGILVGGGPAPGINSVISAATIEAINRGYEVVGIIDGFFGLMNGSPEKFRELYIADVSRIHNQGGSILRTSRANPTASEDGAARCFANLRAQGIGALITIGGDDTAFGAYAVARATGGEVRALHVPKTIDNDLPLPADHPTFGYETARHVGTEIVMNLMEDSRTTNRWFFVVAMGRKTGHLALGIGKSAGATLIVVPEEFPQERISLNDVCRVLEGAILKREVMGREYGLAVIAEGILEKLLPEELETIAGAMAERDPYGHIRLGDIPSEWCCGAQCNADSRSGAATCPSSTSCSATSCVARPQSHSTSTTRATWAMAPCASSRRTPMGTTRSCGTGAWCAWRAATCTSSPSSRCGTR